MNWAIIILVVIGFYILYRTTGLKFGKTWTFLIWTLVIFFVVSFAYVLTFPGVEATSFASTSDAIKTYFLWFGGFLNQAGGIVGQVVATDWSGDYHNSTK